MYVVTRFKPPLGGLHDGKEFCLAQFFIKFFKLSVKAVKTIKKKLCASIYISFLLKLINGVLHCVYVTSFVLVCSFFRPMKISVPKHLSNQ